MHPDLWQRLGEVAEQAGTDRSTVIRDLVRWYVRDPDATPPKRP
jgi:metal-responsive CopG/Arc/MetJ family transcriptional regulator